jgi:hypothetical protein
MTTPAQLASSLLIKPLAAAAVNIAHPLARGLVACYPVFDGRPVADIASANRMGTLVPNGTDDGATRFWQWGEQYYSVGGDAAWLHVDGGANAAMPREGDDWSVAFVASWGEIAEGTFLEWSRLGTTTFPRLRLVHTGGDLSALLDGGAAGTRLARYGISGIAAGEHAIIVVVNDKRSLRIFVNGHGGSDDTTAMTAIEKLVQIQVNGLKVAAGDPTDPDDSQPYMITFWDRALTSHDIYSLLGDPFSYIRPDGWGVDQRDIIHNPGIWRRIPCAIFPNRRVLIKPIEQTAAQEGIIHAAKANRITNEEVIIRMNALDDGELAQLEAAWANGRGQVDSFWMLIPGETEWRRYIFAADRQQISHETTSSRSNETHLLDVTRHGNP